MASPAPAPVPDTWTDVRCPVTRTRGDGTPAPGRLLLRASLASTAAGRPGNIEIACGDCKARVRREGRPVRRVLHWFALDGTLLGTTEEDQ